MFSQRLVTTVLMENRMIERESKYLAYQVAKTKRQLIDTFVEQIGDGPVGFSVSVSGQYYHNPYTKAVDVEISYQPVDTITNLVFQQSDWGTMDEWNFTREWVERERQCRRLDTRLTEIRLLIEQEENKLSLLDRLKSKRLDGFLDWLTYKAFGYH